MDQNRIWQVWQKNCEPATNVCEHHGKRLKTPRQKFVDITAKVCERHGKSLSTSRQKYEHLGDYTKAEVHLVRVSPPLQRDSGNEVAGG